MASSPPFSPPPGFEELTTEKKLEYLHELWALIAAQADEVPVPPHHRDIVAQRREAIAEDPGRLRSYEELKEAFARERSS